MLASGDQVKRKVKAIEEGNIKGGKLSGGSGKKKGSTYCLNEEKKMTNQKKNTKTKKSWGGKQS